MVKEVWLHPADHLTMEEAVNLAAKAGNCILEVDHNNRKILVARGTLTSQED